jgi:hypothetical protein
MDQAEYWLQPDNYIQLDGIRSSHRVLGSDRRAPRIVIMDMGPGFLIPRHYHGCERYEMIVTGSFYSGDEVLHPGDVMLAHANEVYGPKLAGPTGCMTVEVFERLDTSGSVYELDDGTWFALDTTSGDALPENLAGMDWVRARRTEIMTLLATS